MVSMPIHVFGITLAEMKFLRVKTIPILWKETMPNCVMILLVSFVSLAVFHVVLKLSSPP